MLPRGPQTQSAPQDANRAVGSAATTTERIELPEPQSQASASKKIRSSEATVMVELPAPKSQALTPQFSENRPPPPLLGLRVVDLDPVAAAAVAAIRSV